MGERCLTMLLLCAVIASCVAPPCSASQTVILAGQVVDAVTHRPVPQGIVTLVETMQKTASDARGNFSFTLSKPGRYTMSVHHLAYRTLERMVTADELAHRMVIALEPAVLEAEEMVVRSTRTPSLLSTTPYPLSIELADRIGRAHAVTVADALQSVPGLALVRDGSWETALAIRGMSRANIVTIVDDARIETSNDIAGALSLVNVHDLDRVEVMKSPASAQHGSGAIGGVVQLVSKRPSFSEGFETSGEITSDYSTVDGGFSQFGAIEAGTDCVAARISGGVRHARDTQTPAGPLANSHYNDFSLSGSLGVALGGEQTALVTYQRVQAEDTGIPGGSPIAVTATARYTLARRELVGAEFRMPHLASAIPLLTLRAQRQEIDRAVEIINANLSVVTPHAVHTMLSGQAEARIVPMSSMLLTAGAEVWQRKLDSRREKRVGATITGERPLPLSWYTSAGMFVHNDWAVVPERLTVTCGARYDWIRVTNDRVLNPEYVIANGGSNPTPANQQQLWAPGSQRDGSWSAHAGVRYALTPALDLTALGSAAFRSPSLEERYEFIDLGSVVYVGNPALNSEKSLCANAGFRIHSELVNVHADLFLNSMSNLVSQMPGLYESRKAYYRTNIGKAQLHGFEVEIEGVLAPWSSVHVSAAYVRGRDTYNDLNLPQIPPFNGQVEFRGIADPLGTFTLSVPWATGQNVPGAGETATPGYALLHAGFASSQWTFGGTNVTLRTEVRNLFNKEHRNHLSTLRGIIRLEPGRNVVFSATLGF
jgi:hemoglobin/transferrin/lactoferrin receptor protein